MVPGRIDHRDVALGIKIGILRVGKVRLLLAGILVEKDDALQVEEPVLLVLPLVFRVVISDYPQAALVLHGVDPLADFLHELLVPLPRVFVNVDLEDPFAVADFEHEIEVPVIVVVADDRRADEFIRMEVLGLRDIALDHGGAGVDRASRAEGENHGGGHDEQGFEQACGRSHFSLPVEMAMM